MTAVGSIVLLGLGTYLALQFDLRLHLIRAPAVAGFVVITLMEMLAVYRLQVAMGDANLVRAGNRSSGATGLSD